MRSHIVTAMHSMHKQSLLPQSPPHKPGYYSFSHPIPSDPASSVLPSLHALPSSAPPVYPSSDCIPRQSDTDAHLTSRQVPTPDIILSNAPANNDFLSLPYFPIGYSVSSGRYRSG